MNQNEFTYLLYGVAAVLLCFSFSKNKKKTVLSLKKAWKMFTGILPQFSAILLLSGVLLAAVSPEIIQHIIGAESGFPGMIIASLIGAVTLVPVMIAFPIAAELLSGGAGIAQTAVFISSLTTVGLITLPIEIKYLGKKAAILRNVFSFLCAFVTAFIIRAVLT